MNNLLVMLIIYSYLTFMTLVVYCDLKNTILQEM